MSLLEAVTNVANEAGYSVDSVVIGSTDTTTLQLKAIANRVIQEMADRYAWPKLWRSYGFALDDGTASYALPEDFSYYHFDTFWNQDAGFRVLGPMSPQESAEYEGSGIAPLYQRFSIRGVADETLTISPTPGADEASQTLIFEYVSARPVRPQTWETGLTISAGGYCFYDGVYYYTIAGGVTSGLTPATDGGVSWLTYSGPYTQFLADTDEPVLSQRLLEQGMLERFGEIKGLTINPRFDRQLDEEFSKAIPGKTLYAGGDASSVRMWARNGRVYFG